MKKKTLQQMKKESEQRDNQKVIDKSHHWIVDEKLRCKKLVRIND